MSRQRKNAANNAVNETTTNAITLQVTNENFQVIRESLKEGK